jgi:Ca-activated chloride channel family protein
MNRRIEKITACLLIFLFLFSVRAQKDAQKEIRFNVSVADERGKYVGGLKVENFQITVDKKPQEITSFTERDEPATIVFLIDLSGSQKGVAAPLAGEIKRFIKSGNPNNEYVLIAFNTKVELVLDETGDFDKLEEALDKTSASAPKGNTAFYDAVYAAIEKAESGKHQKKVLIACSDGVDNQSHSYKFDDVTKFLKRSDVLFYPVSYWKDGADIIGNMMGAAFITEFSVISGGKSFFPKSSIEMSSVFDLIARELKSQYQIGFRVGDFTKPDKWQEIKIKVAPAANANKQIKFRARARGGFYPVSAK